MLLIPGFAFALEDLDFTSDDLAAGLKIWMSHVWWFRLAFTVVCVLLPNLSVRMTFFVPVSLLSTVWVMSWPILPGIK